MRVCRRGRSVAGAIPKDRVDHTLQPLAGDDRGQVEHSPSRPRAWHAVALCRLGQAHLGRLVEHHARHRRSPAPGDCQLDAVKLESINAVQGRRRPVTGQPVVSHAGGEQPGQGCGRRGGVPVEATSLLSPAPRRPPVVDLLRRHPQVQRLGAGDQPMLPLHPPENPLLARLHNPPPAPLDDSWHRIPCTRLPCMKHITVNIMLLKSICNYHSGHRSCVGRRGRVRPVMWGITQ